MLDNFEQIIDAAPLITDLLSNAPHLKVMVTSRAVLRVYGEHEYPGAALALPDVQHLPTTQALSFYGRYASLQLFKDRARAVKPDFQLTPENVGRRGAHLRVARRAAPGDRDGGGAGEVAAAFRSCSIN